jgi:hypothetical protein
MMLLKKKIDLVKTQCSIFKQNCYILGGNVHSQVCIKHHGGIVFFPIFLSVVKNLCGKKNLQYLEELPTIVLFLICPLPN